MLHTRILYTIDGDPSLEFFCPQEAEAAALAGILSGEYDAPQHVRAWNQRYDTSLRLWVTSCRIGIDTIRDPRPADDD